MGVREFKFFHGITIESEGIVGLIRTLRARWEPETIEDLSAYHAIDAEAELTNQLSRMLAEEIDRDITNQLRDIVEEEDIGRRVARRINMGERNQFIRDNIDYLNNYLNIGDENNNRA